VRRRRRKRTIEKMAQAQLDQDQQQSLEGLLEVDPSYFYFPEFMDTVDKYNATIRETKTGELFEKLINKIADDPKVTPSRMDTLAQMMSRDLILVHNDHCFTFVLNVVHSMVNMMNFYYSQKH
jgi:hypothetical protein